MTDTTPNPADAEILRLATEDEPLELGTDDTPKVDDDPDPNVNDKADDDGDHDDEEKAKRRSKHASQRIAEERWKRGEAERERDDLRAKLAALESGKPADPTATLAELEAKKPKADDFEFGEADSAYIDALTDWKLDVRDAKRDAKAAEDSKSNQVNEQQQQVFGKLQDGMASVEKAGAERYDDFQEKIEAAVEARGGDPLPPLVSIGIAVSPAGADIAYRLATDEDAASKIEKLATTNVMAAALAFGELEGEYIGNDDSDLDLRDPIDQVRLNGRMKARIAGKSPPTEIKTTKAPKPAEHKARGASGQFEVADDAECTHQNGGFAALERKIMGGGRR